MALVTHTAEEALRAIIAQNTSMQRLRDIFREIMQQPFPEVLKPEEVDTKALPAAVMSFGSTDPEAREILLQFQTHGNEPAWVILYDILRDLESAGLLAQDFRIILTGGNIAAAEKYWQHWDKPETREDVLGRVIFRKDPADRGQMNRIPTGKSLSDYRDDERSGLQRAAALNELLYQRENIELALDGHTVSPSADYPFGITLGDITPQERDYLLEMGIKHVISNMGSQFIGGRALIEVMGTPKCTARLTVELGQHEAPETLPRATPIALKLLSKLGALTPAATIALESLTHENPEMFGVPLAARQLEEYRVRQGEGSKFLFPHRDEYSIMVPVGSDPNTLDAMLPRLKTGESAEAFIARVNAFLRTNPTFDSPLRNFDEVQKDDVIGFELHSRQVLTSPYAGHIIMAPRNRVHHQFDEELFLYTDKIEQKREPQHPDSMLHGSATRGAASSRE